MRRRFRKLLLASTLALLGATGAPGWLSPPVLGQEDQGTVQAKEKAPKAPDFVFEGVSFNTTSTEFREAHDGYIFQYGHLVLIRKAGPDTDPKIRVEQYIYPAEAAKALVVNFYKDRLYYMPIVYGEDDMQRIGGFSVLYARLVQKHGLSTEGNTRYTHIWRLGNTYIKVDGTRQDGVVTLDVADVARTATAREAQSTRSNTGF